MGTWDGLDEKEITMDVIKRLVEVNHDVENETMRYIDKVWTERHLKESCKRVTLNLLKIINMSWIQQ